ncbi:hypothetical protein O6H91_08G090000 [Diphasiastrum complanatum]|uniref:Uncharacterized protein n=2 Tax=Diphasiastrum complanatum TaxID=34168 RepID=A0ACC2D0B0_DIPCM|nr:hypothetical protein O6H91_08G029900 [Diphasiastrum complanatum]KAJ7547535.1 hypothetical protein O6H91_08G090000 [Diphasiastrum complanatum]
MKQLPVVFKNDALEKWLLPVQEAIINTNGVFVISGLQGDLTWDQACKIGKKILKTYMRATQHSPYELHPGLDFYKGQARSTSSLRKGKIAANLEDHFDKGLFNVVVGKQSDLQDLQLQSRGGEYHNVVQKLIEAPYHTVFAIVIPGFTLQIFDADLSAARHQAQNQHGIRMAQEFRCRLDPHYKVNGEEIGKILTSTFSKPVTGALNVTVIHFTGEETHLEVTSDTSVEDFKETYCLTKGFRVEDSRFICEGKQLEDGRLLFDYIGSSDQPTIRHVLKLKGRQMVDKQI